MRRFLFLLPFLAISFQGNSQGFWAPAGATWWYTNSYFGSNIIDYIQLGVTGDTVVQGKSCSILSSIVGKWFCQFNPDDMYTYMENDTVYFYDTAFNDFSMLYDFGANPGESWTIITKNPGSGLIDTTVVEVDSVGSELINGQNLRKLWVTYRLYSNGGSWYYYPSTIIEGVGDLRYLLNLEAMVSGACDANTPIELRCYQDSSFALHHFTFQQNCEATNVGLEENDTEGLSIYPNPAQDELYISWSGYSHSTVELFSMDGRRIRNGELTEAGLNWPLIGVDPGQYLIRITAPDGVELHRTLIIH